MIYSELLDKLVDNQCGIILSVDKIPKQNFFPEIFMYRGILSSGFHKDTSGGLNCRRMNKKVIVTGVGYDKESAIMSLLGEGVERYAASCYGFNRGFRSSVTEMSRNFIHPRDFVGFKDVKFRKGKELVFSDDTPIGWTESKDIFSGDKVFVPDIHVYMNPVLKKDEEMFEIPVSTGLAAGINLNDSVMRGVFEVIERDAIALHWILKKPVRPIKNALDLLIEFESGFDALSLKDSLVDFNFYAMESFGGLPAVLARARLKGGRGLGFSLGAAVSSTWSEAISKAFKEACHVWLSYALLWNPNRKSVDIDSIESYGDHGEFYFYNEMDDLSCCFFSGEECVVENEKNLVDMSTLRRIFYEFNVKAYYIDLTTDDVLSLGFHVVRVLIPRLQPLTCGANRVLLDTRRLLAKVGSDKKGGGEAMNRRPHPFA